MPEKKTTLYLNMGNSTQVRVEMVHETEAMPTPHEKPVKRELTFNEMEEVARKLTAKEFFYKPLF